MRSGRLIAAFTALAIACSGCANIGAVNGIKVADASGNGGVSSRPSFCERNLWLCVVGGAIVAAGIGYGIYEAFDDDDEELNISDRAAKRDIALLQRLPNGIGLYRFRYAGSAEVFVGVMAQEVAALAGGEKAISQRADGLMMVDYGRLGLRMVPLATWERHGPLALLAR